MMNDNQYEEGHGHGGHHMMGMMGCCSKEFMIAKLEKKAAIMKIELEFIEKMKTMLKKTDLKSKK